MTKLGSLDRGSRKDPIPLEKRIEILESIGEDCTHLRKELGSIDSSIFTKDDPE